MPRSLWSGCPRLLLFASLASLALFPAAGWGQEDLSRLIATRVNPSRWDPQARLDYYWVHLTNISGRNVYGPLWLAVADVSPAAVTVANASGTTAAGVPYFDITPLMGPDNIFAPGENINVQIVLSNPDHIRNKNSIHFDVQPQGNLVPLRVTAAANPPSGYAPLSVDLSALVAGVATRYEWDFEGDGTYDFSSASSPATSHTYAAPGTYHPTLRVTGPNNAITSSADVEAFAEPTEVVAHASPDNGAPPLAVHLTADATGRVTLYEWDFESDGTYDYSNATSATADHTYPSPGTFHATVRVTGGLVSLTSAATVTVRAAGPPAAPVLDAHAAFTRDAAIDIAGSAPGATSVEVSAPSGIFTVTVGGGRFSARVPLQLNSLNHIVFTGISTLGRGASAATQVTNDQEPPSLAITFPSDQGVLYQDSTDVAGRVSDMLSGFNGLTVQVNGVQAEVDIGIGTNGTFLARSVPIAATGLTTLTATAHDALGNLNVTEIDVTRGVIAQDAPRMAIVSGERQTAQIMELLPQPIVVKVTHPDGSAFANKIVTFHVIRSNGGLSADGATEGGLMLQPRTDADGVARAFWHLGSDAGCGNNRAEVTSTDIVGSFVFCASAMAAPAAQINVGSGNNQKTETGAPTPEPLRVWVSDGCNGAAGIPVVFRVVQGGGKVNGSDSAVVNTVRTGHASVDFMLGPDAGNNTVEATFPGRPDQVARFVAVGLHRDLAAPTRLDGLVLDNSSQPIGGASCSVIIANVTVASGVSDAAGQFHFTDLPAGQAKLRVEGLPATLLNGNPIPVGSFPTLTFDLLLVPNAANSLPTPVLLPPLNPHNARAYSTTQNVELTVEGVEGLKMIVHAGSMRLPNGSPAPEGTIIALNQVQFDKVPMPMPDGAAPPFAWTLQPGGAHFDPPVTIIYPNMSGLPPGAIAYFLSFNHGTNRFEIVAPGSVTEDGLSVTTDAGTGIHVAGWGCNCPPYSVTGECDNCSILSVSVEAENGLSQCMEGRSVTFTATAQGTVPSGTAIIYTFHFQRADGTPWTATVTSSGLQATYTAVCDRVLDGDVDHYFDTSISVDARCGSGSTVSSSPIAIRVFELWIKRFEHAASHKAWQVVVGENIEYEAITSDDARNWVWDMEDGFPDQWNPTGGNAKMGSGMRIPTTDLPSSNNAFGDSYGTANVSCEDGEGNSHQIYSSDLDPAKSAKVFFRRDDTNHPGGSTPNWFYYWGQFIPRGRIATLTYNAGLNGYGSTDPQARSTEISGLAGGLNDETGHDGIHCYYETLAHESHHIVLWEGWWGVGGSPVGSDDTDNDTYPDSWESSDAEAIAYGFVVGNDDSYGIANSAGYRYEEAKSRAIEHALNSSAYDSSDWSYDPSGTYQGKLW